MAIYSYAKKRPEPQRRIINLLSYSSLIIGSLFLFWSFYPIISFQIYSHLFIQNRVLAPVPKSDTVSSLEEANSIPGAFNFSSTNLSDYTKVGLWFPSRKQEAKGEAKIKEYTLSIPKLNINDAKVIVGGEDLTEGLIHYLPISYPWEYGSVSIFGHSTLPALSKPNDYKSIFTYLPSLENGDEILVKIKDATYKYKVYEMFIVKPDQVSVLDQKYDNSYLQLITCTPPGTYFARLVVRAKLEQFN